MVEAAGVLRRRRWFVCGDLELVGGGSGGGAWQREEEGYGAYVVERLMSEHSLWGWRSTPTPQNGGGGCWDSLGEMEDINLYIFSCIYSH